MKIFNFFKNKRKGTTNTSVANEKTDAKFINTSENVSDIFVVTSELISSIIDDENERDLGPKCLIKYFLAKCENGEYYELFTGEKLEKEPEPEDGCVFSTFDTYYVKKAEPLSMHLISTAPETIDTQTLFNFITKLNIEK